MYRYESSMTLPLPLEQVFAFFAQPANLARITPPWLGFRMLTPEPVTMAAGTRIEYRIRWLILPLRWTTLIESYDPPHGFTDVQERGPYALWHHEHTFESTDDRRATIIRDAVTYRLPLGPLGRIAHRLLVREQVEEIFAYRQQRVRALLMLEG